MKKQAIAYLTAIANNYFKMANNTYYSNTKAIYQSAANDFLDAIDFIADLQEEKEELSECLEVNGELIKIVRGIK